MFDISPIIPNPNPLVNGITTRKDGRDMPIN